MRLIGERIDEPEKKLEDLVNNMEAHVLNGIEKFIAAAQENPDGAH